MERFTCANASDNLQIPEVVLATLSIDSAERLHLEAESVFKAARAMEKSGWVRLPFCNTLCGEALGAKPVISLSGARIKEPPYQKVDELPEVFVPDTPRLGAMLRALKMLTAEGRQTAYSIEGPFTLLCALLPMNRVFSALRKPSGEVLLQRAEDWICSYAALAVDRGAKLLSFADPVATVDILGERMFTTVYVPCLKRLLQRLRCEHPDVPIHLCGKLTQCLLDTETCTATQRRLEGEGTYGEALSSLCKHKGSGIVGHFCLNFLDAKRPYITMIEI